MRNKYLCKHFNDKLFTQFRLTVNQKVINNSTIIHTNVRNSLILTLNIPTEQNRNNASYSFRV